jgi:hypothetical protein
VLRGLWALRRAERCSWGDAFRALGIWFALSWVVTLAVVRGLLSQEAAFLRTPKQKEGGNRIWPAVRSSAVESTLAMLAMVGAIVILIAAPAISTVILALMLLFEAWVFGSAPWASFAAEGIHLTPFRRIYGRSAQNTGDRPDPSTRAAALIPGALAIVVAGVLAYGLLNAPPESAPPGQADLPTIGTVTQRKLPVTGPAPTPTPTPTPSPSPSSRSTPSPAPSPSASPNP